MRRRARTGQTGKRPPRKSASPRRAAKPAVAGLQKADALARELKEAREQQAATSEVLKVIASSPGDLAPVFDTILANARRICDARFAHLLLYDGYLFRAVTMQHIPAAFAEF